MSPMTALIYRLVAIGCWLAAIVNATSEDGANSTFINPILPGWHSDPSCIFVPEEDNTFFCATSSFLLTPGIPVFASKDLVNWRLASHALTRESQVPYMYNSTDQNDGIFAPTIRYHEGVYYIITVYVFRPDRTIRGLIFNTTNPFENSWSEPVRYESKQIDPDLFWDVDDKTYMTQTPLSQTTIDVMTGVTGGEPYRVWNGTGGPFPEGPHIFLKDDWYYLLTGEGGTQLDHAAMIARARTVQGPYEGYENNPILTARKTQNFFQTVGHADFFQDAQGNWWAIALATRSGPQWNNYPLGRETVLTPVTWAEGEWPVVDPIVGRQTGWPLPPPNFDVGGIGPIVGDPDDINFESGSSIPPHFMTWRWPVEGVYEVSPPDHPNTLRVRSSRALSASKEDPLAGADGISLVLRLQTDTLFTFSVDVEFKPENAIPEQEAGLTAWLTQWQHLDIGIVMLEDGGSVVPKLRLRSTGRGRLQGDLPRETLAPVPSEWLDAPITLEVRAKNETHYTFAAGPSGGDGELVEVGSLPAQIVSGDSGVFTGSLVGAYATTNGGESEFDAFFSRWRYQGNGQRISEDEYVPSRGQ